MPHSWKCSRSSWTSLWTTCSLVKDVPACGRKAGLDDLERFLPTQTTLTFTDQREHLHNLFKKGCKFLGLCACALEISIYRNETVTSSSLNSWKRFLKFFVFNLLTSVKMILLWKCNLLCTKELLFLNIYVKLLLFFFLFPVQWAVLTCGHCFCNECIAIIIEQYSVGTRRSSIKCAICRQTTSHKEISYVFTAETANQEDDIPVKVKHLCKLADPNLVLKRFVAQNTKWCERGYLSDAVF